MFKAGGRPCTPLYPFAPSVILSLPPSLHLKKKEGWKGKRAKRSKIGKNTKISKVLPSLPPRALAGQDWILSTVMPGHMQKLVKHGFMAVTELKACRVLKDPAFPTPAEGYVDSFVEFYERGFGMPPHQFLHSLLRYYDLELHHLIPLGVVHIAAFITLCEAYLGINPELDLWKYFFRVRRLYDPKAELTISGGAVIHVKAGHRVDPYL
jgi:hypothetical protein